MIHGEASENFLSKATMRAIQPRSGSLGALNGSQFGMIANSTAATVIGAAACGFSEVRR